MIVIVIRYKLINSKLDTKGLAKLEVWGMYLNLLNLCMSSTAINSLSYI